MPAKFRAANATIKWHGKDDTTPPGHSIAIGTDGLGTMYLWLFKGDDPTDEAFVGSIHIPAGLNKTSVAYNKNGGYVGTVSDTTTMLARLANEVTTMTEVKIIECSSPAELYHHYTGQSDAQDAYIELDMRDGALLADYNSEVGNALPDTVRNGVQRRWAIPVLTADAANRVMNEIKPLATRVFSDWKTIWDGHNEVLSFGEDGQAAEKEILTHLELRFDQGDLVAMWEVDSVVNGEEVAEYGITDETSDERLAEIAAQITSDLAEVSPSAVAVVHGLDEYLTNLRDNLEDAKS